MKEDDNEESGGCYKFGIFYFDKTKKNVFVMSQNRLTLNFANKWSYLVLAIIVLFLILCFFASRGDFDQKKY